MREVGTPRLLSRVFKSSRPRDALTTEAARAPGKSSPALVADDAAMPSRATERVDAARRPTNASVAVVASAEKDTAPGHLAASPLRDRTNVQAAAAEASPSSDAVAESEEEEDSAPARSRRPFGVPVGAANRAVLEQMLRREAPRSALTRVSPEASPSGRSGAAEPPRSDASPVEPHRRESRRKRRRRRSQCGSREEDAVEEEDASRARRGKRRNAPGSPSAFEVVDGAGDVSEHSDASHDRTAGVRGFNFQELRGDAYGRGRRRGNGGDANRVARRIAERRERGGRALRRFSSDSDSDSDSDSGSDDASPLEDEDVRARRVVAADDGDGDGHDRVCLGDENALLSDDAPRGVNAARRFDASRDKSVDASHPRLAEEAPRRRIATQTRLDQWVPRRDPRDVSRILVTADLPMRSQGDRRQKQNATDDDETRRRSARKKRPAAPWAFPATTDAFDGALRAAARAANDAFRRSPQDSNPDGPDGSCASDPTTLVRVAARLFRAHASCANHSGAPRDMSPADLAAWTRAARACERERPGSGKGVFWRVVAACAAETRRGVEDEEDTGDDVSEDEDAVGNETRHDSRHLCALEASWELIFVAARAWRSAETDDSDDGAAGRRDGATRPPLARLNGVETSWAEPAWRAVSDLLEASPLEENEKIAEAAAARVAALAKAWPRCAATAAPAWEIWRRVGRLGKPPTGAGKEGLATTREGGANAGGPRGEYPAEAVAAAAAAAAAAEARVAFVGETSAAGAASAAAASSAAASRAARFFSCSCCEIPPPSSARPASGASLGCLVPAATSACASALDALAAHVGAASDARDVRRDLGKVLSAAAFVFASKRDDEKTTQVSTTTRKENETVAGKQQTNGTLSSSQTSRFRAFGGASAPCTAHSAAVRHRAATHARLMGVCLEHGMPDQAGACLRQMRAALAPGRLPSAAVDPAPLAAAARAVRVAAEAWLACARRRGKEAFKSDKGADLLAKEGEAAIDALFAAAAEAGAETRVGDAGETSESRESSQTTELPVPGTDLARRAGIVVAEAAAAAATTYAALVASGARPEGAAETQTRFCAFLFLPRSARDTRDSWPSRVFALRALAALLVPNTWLSLETSACSSAESLVPALAAWAATASDAAAGGVGPLAAALFKHPRLPRLNEGAAAGDADAAEAVARLQRGSGVFGTHFKDTDRDDNHQSVDDVPESSASHWVTWRALRGENLAGGSFSTEPPRSFSGFFFGGGAAAEAARSHARERAAAACVGGVPGDAMGAHEAAFRSSAGALVGAQIAECGAAGAAAIATLVAQFPAAALKRAPGFLLETKTDHPSFLDGTFNGRRSRTADGVFGVFGGTAKTHHSTTRDVDDSRRLEAEASARRAHAVSVAGAARWLAEAAARTANAWPPSIDSKAAPRSSPALAVIAGAGGASFRASPAFDLLRRDGRAGETARLAFAAAAARWAAARAARTAGDGDGDGDEIWDAAFAAATRDLAACTVGVLEWTLGEDEEDGDEAAGGVEGTMLDALAFALADERFEGSSAAAAAVLSRLVPRFLAAETRQAPQRRCARVWLSALALCRRLLAREDEARAVDAVDEVSQGSRAAHSAAARRRPNANARNAISAGNCLFSDTLSTPGVMLLDAVANENEMGGDMRHQAAAAVADLIGLVAERLDVASGVAAARAAPAAATTAPPPRAPATRAPATRAPATRAPAQPAPAPSSGYFPFPGTASATAAAAARDEAAERDAARASAAAALEEARLRERRARDSAEARMAASASLRSAAAAASLSAAASASLASPAAARLLGACATFAVASLASAALAASAAATTASRAFVSLGARRGGGGGAREEDSDRARAREVSRARAALVLALDRAKARLAAEAREVSRYDFSGAGVDPVAGGSSSRCANLALADLGAAVGFFPAGDEDPEVKPNASATGSSAFWGCAPVPPGSHRAPASWSAASPEERSAKLALCAAAFLLALARRCEVSCAREGNDSSSEEARAFFASRRNRGDEDVFASLLAPHLETLARAASLLGEASNPREVSALLAETLRLRRVAVPRLPSSSSSASSSGRPLTRESRETFFAIPRGPPSRVSERGNGRDALSFGGRGRGARGRGGLGGASRGV